MDNALVIDLALAALLVFLFIHGARRGLVRGIMGLVSVLVALFGAAALTAQLTEPVMDYVYPYVQENAERYLTERAAEPHRISVEDTGDGEALTDAVNGMLAILHDFGVSDETIDGVTRSLTQSAVSAAERAAYALVESIVRAGLFLVCFLLLLIACRLLMLALNELCALPILWHVNLLGGALLSLVKGVLLIFLVVSLAPRFGVTWFVDHAEGTHLLAWFLNNTPVSLIASLF